VMLLFFFGTPALLALVGLALGWYVEYREPPPRHPGATAMSSICKQPRSPDAGQS
jgi:hypothetical protein